jgi:hypothetical protein
VNATDKKQLLSRYESIFAPFIGKEITIAFSDHSFTLVLEQVRIATQKQMQNLPDKVDGKTPQVLQMCFAGDNMLNIVTTAIDSCNSTLRGAELVTIDGIKVSFNVSN